MRVLISGYYGFGNAGDEALLEGLLAGLERRGHEPLVLSSDPAGTRRLHGVAAAHRVKEVLPALLRSEALVSGGGGLMQDATSRLSLRYYLAVLRAARLLRRRVVLYGQSIGPLSTGGRLAVARALRGVPAAVRDAASLELLDRLGVASTLVADPALLLRPSVCETTTKSSAGRSPAPAGTASDASRPVLLVPRSGQSELGEALAAVGRHLLQRGRRVEILALHPSEDLPEARRLAGLLAGAALRKAADHRQALLLIDGAGLVLSARLHGLILAAAAATPFVGLVYDPKVSGFLLESGARGFAPPVDHAGLIEAAESAEALPQEVRSRLRERAEAGLDWLDRRLRGTSD
jgi:polysaccharide pyruvyl transferase CsaB